MATGQVALLGDAAHTAHFSVGSGTKMAMEDAVALAEALGEAPHGVPEALEIYEERRRPKVEKIQNSARPSLSWWEHFGRYVRRSTIRRSSPSTSSPAASRAANSPCATRRTWTASTDGGGDTTRHRPWRHPSAVGPFRLPSRRVTVGDDLLTGTDGTGIPMVPFSGQSSGRGRVDRRPGHRGGAAARP